MLAVTGFRTTIVQELAKLISDPIARISGPDIPAANRFVFAAGVLHQKNILEQSEDDIAVSLTVNLIDVLQLCERILTTNRDARICVIGSVSAYRGSYDQTYAVAKAGVHAYSRFRDVLPTQQLTVVAPPIIRDSGMTLKRKDYPAVLKTRCTVSAAEVAAVVKRCLYDMPPGHHGVEHMPC